MNLYQPVLSVRHADLERASDESDFRSVCPVCGGILLVRRDQRTFALIRHDNCTRCGQRVYYTDDAIAGCALPKED